MLGGKDSMNNGERPAVAPKDLRIGVLAIQGAFREHIKSFQFLADRANDYNIAKISIHEIRTPQDFELYRIDALVIPGGESTTMEIVAKRSGVWETLREWVHEQKRPTWGTCAGLILLSKSISAPSKRDTEESKQSLIGGLDITVERNAFGSQANSFMSDLQIHKESSIQDPSAPFPGVFIRSPKITRVGEGVRVLASMNHPEAGLMPVAVQHGHIMGCMFHPELTRDIRFHAYFINMALGI